MLSRKVFAGIVINATKGDNVKFSFSNIKLKKNGEFHIQNLPLSTTYYRLFVYSDKFRKAVGCLLDLANGRSPLLQLMTALYILSFFIRNGI
jgi:hypothetical protein